MRVMSPVYTGSRLLKGLLAASIAMFASKEAKSGAQLPEPQVEIQITPVSTCTFRLSILPLNNGSVGDIAMDGSLVKKSWGSPIAKLRAAPTRTISAGNLRLKISFEPVSIEVANLQGDVIQHLAWDENAGIFSFLNGSSPLFGLGEGGPQFDRRGSTDSMRSGQGGYKLATHGGRLPIPWVIGTSGWAIFFHQPYGAFDITGQQGKFQSATPGAALDLFFVGSADPTAIMAEYAGLTGFAEMPPLWSFGYQQSHRTLASREEVLAEAKTFREKGLPCDALIYLGTGFCPSGWNTENGSFVWNSRAFPDPKEMLDELHRQHFHAVMHVVILSDRLRGTVHDPCDVSRFDEESASCYWDTHRKDFAMGVDGWWPDEGDPLDIPSRLVRNRMYWEGPQLDRPNERPYALHRNGYGGMPYWGTDIGGFVPTQEFTAELYVRWFQFGAFCPLFRCHGRTWKLRLPWGWNTGDPGPVEINNYNGAAILDSSQLHDVRVEPICRKYLELRYRLLPYLYSAVHECATTGMPIMRALWLHFPDDPKAVECGDQYLWGRNVLVAPVIEKGAATRRVYLPRGTWYDFWTHERVEGGREFSRPVDLETMPLYVREGSILPLGPVKQFTGEIVEEPLSVSIYPGADASFLLYEDDGSSFNYRKGEWMGIQMEWNDARRILSLHLAPGSRLLPPESRAIAVKVAGTTHSVTFDGKPVQVSF